MLWHSTEVYYASQEALVIGVKIAKGTVKIANGDLRPLQDLSEDLFRLHQRRFFVTRSVFSALFKIYTFILILLQNFVEFCQYSKLLHLFRIP